MRLIMVGTGPFGVPTFRGLCGGRHKVAALVTSPLRTARGQELPPASGLREIAREQGTPVFDPERINDPQSCRWLAECRADLLVVCDFGQILRPQTLAVAAHGGINLHASLLPKYRGAAPINWAIYNGESETGVTVIHMTPQVDAGPAIARAATAIGPEETAVELEARLARLGADLVCHAVDALADGPLAAIPQDPALASPAPRLRKSDGAIDWTRSAAAIKNQVRALEPWPKTYTFCHHRGQRPVRLILGPVRVVELAAGPPPGTVLEAAGDRLLIAAGQGAVAPQGLQPAGKRPMNVAQFLRGYRLEPGDRFTKDEGGRRKAEGGE